MSVRGIEINSAADTMAKILKEVMFWFGDFQRHGITNRSTLGEVLLRIPKTWSHSAKCCLEWSQGVSPLGDFGGGLQFHVIYRQPVLDLRPFILRNVYLTHNDNLHQFNP